MILEYIQVYTHNIKSLIEVFGGIFECDISTETMSINISNTTLELKDAKNRSASKVKISFVVSDEIISSFNKKAELLEFNGSSFNDSFHFEKKGDVIKIIDSKTIEWIFTKQSDVNLI